MKLVSLHLENFRNYEAQDIVFGEGVNILYGDNAQGKTNVVEAVHLLATGKSHRTRHLADLIRHGTDGFRIEAVLQQADRPMRLMLAYDRRKGKQLLVNDIPRQRWSELLGMLHVLMFSPETMDVVKGGPAERRRFLDILLCQLDARYLRCLQQYTALLRQKSAALRERGSQGRYEGLFPVWNEGMAKSGGYVAWKRMETALRIERLANRELQVLSGGREKLVLTLQTFTGATSSVVMDKGEPTGIDRTHVDVVQGSEGFKTTVQDAGGLDTAGPADTRIATQRAAELAIPSVDALAGRLHQKLERMLQREREAGQCLAGVHRDELQIGLNDSAARVFASQGQQRSVALSLILASMYLYREEAGELPLLLLDDVMSELDPMRQQHLIQVLEKTQTLITTTDRKEYGSQMPPDTHWFEVRQGSVAPFS